MSKKTLSLDLRERVVGAVATGMSRREAAERFGVSPASAVRWCRRERETGSPAAQKRGGDRWSARIDTHKSLILSLIDATCDITLKELRTQLAERGHHFSIGSLWRFFARHDITWKKDRPRERARPPGHKGAARSVVREPARSFEARLHRRDLGDDEYGAQEWTCAEGRAAARRRSARPCMDAPFDARGIWERHSA